MLLWQHRPKTLKARLIQPRLRGWSMASQKQAEAALPVIRAIRDYCLWLMAELGIAA